MESKDGGAASLVVDIGLLIVVWIGLLALLLVRGRKGAPSLLGVKACSGGYWLITALGLAWLLLVSVVAGRRLVRTSIATRRRYAAHGADVDKPLEGDVRWDGGKAARALVLAILAGLSLIHI